MARLIAALLRHGAYRQLADTPSAHQPFGLTARGARQAAEAAELLADTLAERRWQLDPVIDSSRLLRAWQTARAIADRLAGAQRVEQFDALAERSVGIAANLSVAQIEQVLAEDPRYPAPPPGWKADSHYCLPLPGAESLLQAGRRVADHLAARMRALASEGGRDRSVDRVKLFVGHGAAFRHAAHHLGALALDEVAALSMYHARPVFLEVGDDRWHPIAGNWKPRPSEAWSD